MEFQLKWYRRFIKYLTNINIIQIREINFNLISEIKISVKNIEREITIQKALVLLKWMNIGSG